MRHQLPNNEEYNEIFSVIKAIESIIKNAKSNDGIVNFWS